MSAYQDLLKSIDLFIRRYYKNRMIRGLIWFFTFFLILFLSVITFEYFGRFSSTIRFVLFLSFVSGSFGLLVYFIIIPLSKLFSFGKVISREQASKIIGDFFPDIQDKLANTLQLGQQMDSNNLNLTLLQASIQRRSEQLTVFDFKRVIDFKYNLKFIKYLAFPLLIFLFFLIFNPSFLKDSGERVISYNKTFVAPKDFNFFVDRLPKSVSEGNDLPISLTIKGRKLPESCYIHTSQGSFLMERKGKNKFQFTFSKVSSQLDFYFTANEERSDTYEVRVIPQAVIGLLTATIHYPSYLDKPVDVIKNAADLTIPEGSVVEWNVVSSNTRKVDISFLDTSLSFPKHSFSFKKRFKQSSPYKLFLTNAISDKEDTLSYSIQVIKDAFPTIHVTEQLDSVASSIRFFEGKIGDDYGLTNLEFVYSIQGKSGKKRHRKIPVVSPKGTAYSFNFAYDFRRDSLSTDDVIEYYFVVTDNDGVNGHKSSKSQVFQYNLPSKDELIEKRNETLDKSKDEMNAIAKQINQFKKNTENLKRETLFKNSNQWDLQNKLSNLQQEQQSLENRIKQLQNQLQESLEEKQSLQQMDPALMEKYDLLQDLLNQVMDDEMKKLLEEMQELLQKNKNNSFDQKMNEFDAKNQNLNEKLDRALDLLKRTQANELMKDIKNSLDELSTEQDKLKEDYAKNMLSKDAVEKKQKEIDNKFNQLKEDYNQLKELNKDLKTPFNLEETDKLSDEISNELNNSQQEISKNQSKKAQSSQKSASEKMQEMSNQLQMMQDQAQQEQNSEDMKLIRSILKSLISLSIDQESTISKVQNSNVNDPYFSKLGRLQIRLNNSSKPILDSLLKLASRQPQIASFIDNEIDVIGSSQRQIIAAYGSRFKSTIAIHSQLLMTSYNNLALLLNESLQQMQQQMQQQGMGGGQCDKPGSGQSGKQGKSGSGGKQGQGSDGMGDMKEMLKKQIEQMKKAMGEGSSPGNGSKGKDGNGQGGNQGQPGQNGTPGQNGLPSSELAKMIAEQRMLRQQLEQLRQLLNKDGKGTGNSLNPLIDELDKQEKDLLNRNIGRTQLNRQQEILTRLLESEKAIKERGFSDKRESKVGKTYNLSNQNRIEEYNKKKLSQMELFRTVDPSYTKYYKDKAAEYFNRQF